MTASSMGTKTHRFSSPWWSLPYSRRRSLQLWGADRRLKWSGPHIINPLCGQSLILFELQTKKEHPDLIPSPTPNLFPLNTNIHSSQLLLSLENGSLHPQSGAGLTPCTLGLQRSLWEDVNSASSLLQESMTQDLLDPWSRAWSTGSIREAEFSHAG